MEPLGAKNNGFNQLIQPQLNFPNPPKIKREKTLNFPKKEAFLKPKILVNQVKLKPSPNKFAF